MRIGVIIMAAGQGTRMHSSLPKVLHRLLGKPMLEYSLEAARSVTDVIPIVVIGHGVEEVRRFLGERARFAIQEPQLGTGHAVLQAAPHYQGEVDLVLVLPADLPLLRPETLRHMLEIQKDNSGPITLLTAVDENARGFGRVVRDGQGAISAIVEEAQATPEQLSIQELNVGSYCFEADWLWQALRYIPLSKKGEYYLTDLAGIAAGEGKEVRAYTVTDKSETIGVNTRVHLAEAETALRRRLNREYMLAGVTFIDPAVAYIEPGVVIGKDTVIWPNTFIQGNTIIGENCVLGPNAIIRDTQIGNRCKVFASVLQEATVEDGVDIGPYGHLRKGTHLAEGVHMGNFGEIKNSYLGPGAKVGHFSYIGDATIGAEVNIGAGTITCNYDGEKKNPTEIGEGAFIGSDTMLVAPVKIGEGAKTGAGSVVTKNVPPHSLAVGMPARVIRKLEKSD